MTPSQRIILNTAASYGRSLFAMALGLFSSRWVLQALGQDDFGLFSLVGSVIVFITFLNGTMSSSVSRHYAYAIGQSTHCETQQQKIEAVKKWFNTALSIHLILPALLILIGYPIGAWCIQHYFVIDPIRITACMWVFRFSLIAAYINMASVPFIALYTAKQLIAELSIIGFLSSFLAFGCAYGLLHVSTDRLIAYAFFMMLIHALIPLIQCLRARLTFPECRLDFTHWFDRQRFYQLTSFAGWQLFGSLGAILRGQGTAILLNRYFGTKVNAAYGISNTLVGQTQTLSSSLIGAFTPALTATEGAGNRNKTIDMAFRMCKFGTFLVVLFAVPLILEMRQVLVLWLKNPPLHTEKLCVLMLVMLLIDKITVGHMVAIAAHGKIAAYQFFLAPSILSTLPLAWLFIHWGLGVVSVGYAFILTMTVSSLGRVFFAKYLLNMSPWEWVLRVLFPMFSIILPSLLCGFVLQKFQAPSFLRILETTALTFLCSLVFGFMFVFDEKERTFFVSHLKFVLVRRKK